MAVRLVSGAHGATRTGRCHWPTSQAPWLVRISSCWQRPAVIAEHEPDRVVTFEIDAKRMDITGRMSFSPAGSGIRLDGEFDLRPKGVMRVMLPLVAPLVRRDFPKQFANFKAFAEQR